MKKNSFSSSSWILYLLMGLIFPFIWFGIIGFYGDDFNQIQGIEEFGFLGNISQWVNSYGIFYRPLGYFFLTSIYFFLGSSEALIYFFNLLLFFLACYFTFLLSYKLFSNKFLSVFVTLFFGFFPFNASAYLQISSSYMIICYSFVAFFFLKLMSYLNEKNKKYKLFLLNSLWFLILLIYEQATGLILLILINIFYVNFLKNGNNWIKKSCLQSSGFIFVTMLFVFLYFGLPGNPKVETLIELNNQEVETISSEISSEEIVESESSRFTSLALKIFNSFSLFYMNFPYVFENLGIYISISLILMTLLMSYLIPNKICVPNKNKLFKIFIMGFLWTILTMAPFFLYKSFYMPPYVFVFPSFGLGLSIFSIFFLLVKSTSDFLNNLSFKILIFSFSLFFIVQNYGIYLGTKEEIIFWKKLSKDIKNSSIHKENSLIIDRNISFKNNHIFWLEELYGIRYFRHSVGERLDQINIVSKGNEIHIKIHNSN
tara:strand:+ start:875 stop:2332 length:1458 start_codon:yes stop_codon:yes gene_type:complete